MTRKTLLVLGLAALLLGACGGDDPEVGTVAPTSTLAPVTTVVAPSTSTPTPSSSTTLPPGESALTATSTLDLRGLGPVRVGMTLPEASAAAELAFTEIPSGSDECFHVRADGGPEGVDFMVTNDRISRVSVRQGSPIKTLRGAGVGDTENQVQALYANRLEVTDHKYVPGGHYLTLVPTDAVDADYRLIFETDGSKVTTFRSGKLPEVAYVEGCS